jgi:hypothetical protein
MTNPDSILEQIIEKKFAIITQRKNVSVSKRGKPQLACKCWEKQEIY